MVFHEHQPRFGEWDIRYEFAAGSGTAGQSGGSTQRGRGPSAPPLAASLQLPPAIQADRYLRQAEQAVRSGDAAGARAAMERLEARAGADQVLIDLLPEPEYLTDAAAAMVRDFVPKREHSFDTTFRYDLMWAAREGRTPPPGNDQRRTRFVAALKAEIKRQREQNEDGESAAGLKELANVLASIDGRGSAAAVLDVIAMPGQWDQYTRLDAAERLLMAGVVLPATTAFALADSILERTEKWMQDSDKYLLRRILALCPFVDDPAAGIAKVCDVLRKRRLRGYELRELVTALGESRSDAAIDLLYELASDAQTFEQCEDTFINAVARARYAARTRTALGFLSIRTSAASALTRPSSLRERARRAAHGTGPA